MRSYKTFAAAGSAAVFTFGAYQYAVVQGKDGNLYAAEIPPEGVPVRIHLRP